MVSELLTTVDTSFFSSLDDRLEMSVFRVLQGFCHGTSTPKLVALLIDLTDLLKYGRCMLGYLFCHTLWVAMCDLLQRQLFDIREHQPMLQKEIVLQRFVVYL